MKKRTFSIPFILFAVILFTGISSFSGQLHAQTIKPVTVKSSKNFEGTLNAIKKAVSGGGMMVLSELNQGKILSMTGLQVNAHSFFIGNPHVGNKAFSADPSVGLVLPVRVNVYEENGVTYVNYYKPSDLAAYSHNKQVKMIANKLDGKLAMMMKMISE